MAEDKTKTRPELAAGRMASWFCTLEIGLAMYERGVRPGKVPGPPA